MSGIAANFAQVRERIASACEAAGRAFGDVELLAVSKYNPADAVREALAAGQVAFGESRVQELVAKANELQAEPTLQWHIIGSVQTNKVRDIVRVPNLALVHSVDRVKLANELHRELVANDRQLNVLLQVNATDEEQKHGCLPGDARALLDHISAKCPSLNVCGLMAMGPLQGEARPVFDRVVALRDDLRKASGLALDTLSLGMSGDLEQAIAAGSTMVRVGTALFGAR
ncbi:MAG: pyridoxal phosphate enzyme (YggS family) [Planctomycetota bacterium]|jgi:pyridoxal phosphate enzyme (YggS family)